MSRAEPSRPSHVMHLRRCGALLVTLGVGCTNDVAAPIERAAPAEPAVVSPVSDGPTNSIAAPTPPTPVAAPVGPFHLVARRRGNLKLHELGDASVWISGGVALARAGDAGGVERRPDLLRRLAEGTQFSRDPREVDLLTGASLATAWLITTSQEDRVGTLQHLWRRGAEGWIDVPLASYSVGHAAWSGGSLLAMQLDRKALRMRLVVAGAPRAKLPRLPKGADLYTLHASLSGAVFATAELADQTYAVLRWAPGARDPTIESLPAGASGPAPSSLQLRVEASGRALAFACTGETPYLARFTGTMWKLLDVPPRCLDDAAESPDGEMWALTRDADDAHNDRHRTLWRRPEGGAWAEVALPAVRFPAEAVAHWHFDPGGGGWQRLAGDPALATREFPVEAEQLVVRGPDDVWVAGQASPPTQPLFDIDDSRWVVFHTRPAPAVVDLPTNDVVRLEQAEYDDPLPWPSPYCAWVWIPLRELADDLAPAPELANIGERLAGVAGLRFFIAQHRGAHQLGVLIADWRATPVRDVLTRLEEVAPGAVAQCRLPVIERELALEASGLRPL